MIKGISLLMDLYELTMAECFLHYKQNTRSTFDLFVRQLPENRSYLVVSGLEDALNYLSNLKFSEDDLDYLKSLKVFSGDFLKYLKRFRFSGDVWAMREGEIFFANEPVIRITAPIIEAQIIESFLLNTINLQAMIASKASRIAFTAQGKKVFDFALRRTHGIDAGIKVARASFIAGFSGTSNVLAGKLYNIPVAGTMAHSFVMSFRDEIDSFLSYCETFPSKSILLVDTYDTKKGIENAIKAGLYLKENKFRLQGIRLDSGDIASLSKIARQMLDKAGLGFVKIFASGNLEESKISKLLKKGALVDSFGVGTSMGTSSDAPSLDVIYKLCEVTGETGEFLPVMKLSKSKVTYPGRKQVYRLEDRKGIFIKDILGLQKESFNATALLRKVMHKGKIIYKLPGVNKIRDYHAKALSKFPLKLKQIHRQYEYPVAISQGLKELSQKLSKQLRDKQ